MRPVLELIDVAELSKVGDSGGDAPSVSSSMVSSTDVRTSDEDDSNGRKTGPVDHSDLSLCDDMLGLDKFQKY